MRMMRPMGCRPGSRPRALWRVLTFALLVGAAASVLPSQASAQYGPQPQRQLYYQNTTVARMNPLGLINRFNLQYRYRLFRSNSIFLRDNFIGAGMYSQISPAFVRFGPRVELKPVPFVILAASYESIGYLGNFDFVNSYANPAENYSDSNQDRIGNSGNNYGTFGHELTLELTLQIAAGPVAIRNVTRVGRPDFELENGDRFFYDPVYDILQQDEGWYLENNLDVLYLHADKWTVGARYTLVTPFYDGVDRGNNGPFDRIGPVLAYTFFKKYKDTFNGPSLIVLMQWWTRHRWRTGDAMGCTAGIMTEGGGCSASNGTLVTDGVSQFFPYIIIGFDFRGDLLPNP